MRISDDTLMAYADGELDQSTRQAVEQAMREDPAIAARVEQHRSLRSAVFAAFAPILEEAVPQRLQQVTEASPAANVVRLDTERASRKQVHEARRWSWMQWGAMAASLVIGILAGRFWMPESRMDNAASANFVSRDGALLAHGELEQTLSQQLASVAPADAPVRIGVSFLSKEGSYCRSFILNAAPAVGGLACRQGQQWRIPILAESAATTPAAGAYRPAAVDTPPAILQEIDRRIAGQTLDAAAELAAQCKGWQP